MSLSPLTKELPDPLAVCRHRFESVFDMHGVKTGSPEDLARFIEKLRTDRYFAMDFWEIAESAGRLGDRGISRTEIRETVVQCVGGPGVRDTDPNVQEVQREFNGKLPGEIPPVELPQSAGAAQTAVQHEGDKAIDGSNLSSDASALTPKIAPDGPAYTIGSEYAAEETTGTLPPNRSRQMDDALARLEINSNALKLQLDNIDNRMSRIEPHIEDLSSLVAKPESNGPQAGAASASGPAVAEDAAREKGAARERRKAERRSMWPDGRSRILAIAPVLLVVMLGVLMAWLWGLQYRSRHPAANRSGQGVANGVPSGAAASTNVAPGNVPTTAEIDFAANANREVRASNPAAPIDEVSQSKKRTGHVTSRSAAAGDGAAGNGAAPNGLSARSEGSSLKSDEGPLRSNSGGGTDANQAEESSRNISVSYGVMAANLIHSHPPDYPRLARLAHIQGPVVLQVFISKNGIVDHVHAVNGHRLLRGAAKKAVKQWRYKPYLLNGVPTEVGTIVKMDFRLGK